MIYWILLRINILHIQKTYESYDVIHSLCNIKLLLLFQQCRIFRTRHKITKTTWMQRNAWKKISLHAGGNYGLYLPNWTYASFSYLPDKTFSLVSSMILYIIKLNPITSDCPAIKMSSFRHFNHSHHYDS